MITAENILTALMDRYKEQYDWLTFPELKMGTGYKNEDLQRDNERSIDLFVFHTLPSKKWHRIAIEIKVNMQDLYREFADPTKRRAAFHFSNEFYFATPKDMVDKKILPHDCGLIEVCADRNDPEVFKARIKVPALWHDNAPNWGFVASLARRINREVMP